jgi:hypothetical protein
MKLSLALFLAVPAIAFARVGENKEALIKRLGQPEKGPMNAKILTFKSKGFVIECKLVTNVCYEERYTLESGEAFTTKGVEDLLDALSNYREIVELTDAPTGQKRWTFGRWIRDRKVDWVLLSLDKKTVTVSELMPTFDTKKKPNPSGF